MKVSYKQPQGQYNVLVKKEYDSWSSSHYSPTGLFKYEFPMSEFLLPTEGRTLHATQSDLVLTIDCEMKNNKFINLEITEHMSDINLEITIQDIYENIRTASTMVFDYDLTRILPVPMWDKDNIDNYIDNNINEEYTMHVNSVLLATAYILYSNYIMTKPYAVWLITQPLFFRRNNIIDNPDKNSQEFLDLLANKNTIKLINNIDRELYIPSNDGSKSGYLTAKGENILHNFLFTYGYNQKDIENIFTTD